MRKNDLRQSEGTPSLMDERTPSKISGLSYTVSACAILFVSLLFGFFPQKKEAQWYKYLNFLLPQISFLIVAAWYFLYMKVSVKSFVKEQKCSPKYYLIAFLLQVGLLSLGELNTLFLKFLEKFGYENSNVDLPSVDGVGIVGTLFVVAVLPAIMEEVFFRGVLLRDMRGSTLFKTISCGALFALYHQNPAQTVYQFICGACFALVAIRSGSILPTVLSHFINNAVILLLYKFGVDSYPIPAYVIMLVVSGVCLVGSLIYLIWLDRKKKTGEKRNAKVFFLYAAIGIAIFALSWISTLVSGF